MARLLTTCQTSPNSSSLLDLYAVSGYEGIGVHTLVLEASSLVFYTLLTLVQSRRVRVALRGWLDKSYRLLIRVAPAWPEDQDVVDERAWMAAQPPGSPALALSVRDLYKYYSSAMCAVRRLTFGVRRDDCFGLLGVNGAGKTTTFDILTGVLIPTSGTAAITGASSTIGYCPQFDALPKDLTGGETLRLIGYMEGLSGEVVGWRMTRILDAVRLRAEADKLVGHYSGGQKRRLAIGVALMAGSRLVMLDEPTAGVDPSTRRHIWTLLRALRRNGTAILMTSHSMEEVERLCTRVGFMNKGQLVSIGASQHLKSK